MKRFSANFVENPAWYLWGPPHLVTPDQKVVKRHKIFDTTLRVLLKRQHLILIVNMPISLYKEAHTCECGYTSNNTGNWCSHKKRCKLVKYDKDALVEQMKQKLADKDRELAAKDEQLLMIICRLFVLLVIEERPIRNGWCHPANCRVAWSWFKGNGAQEIVLVCRNELGR